MLHTTITIIDPISGNTPNSTAIDGSYTQHPLLEPNKLNINPTIPVHKGYNIAIPCNIGSIRVANICCDTL